MPELVLGKSASKRVKDDLGALVGLGCDEALALEDTPDGCPRWQRGEAFGEVVEDGLGAGIEAGAAQLRL